MSSQAPDTDFNPAATDHIERHVWVVCCVVILGMIMSILDTTIVNVALNTLSKDLHSPLSQVQWVITGYLLSLAAVIPVTGWAARRFGAKQVYMVSLVLFTAGSALCGLANSVTSLVIFRILQGAGGGMIMPVAMMIMAQVAGPKRMGRVMGFVSMPAMIAPILGPVVGGVILENLHWSWIFFVNVPIGLIAFVLGWRLLPRTDSGVAGRLDVLGLALLPTGCAAVIYGISKLGSGAALGSAEVIAPTLAGVVLIVLFCFHALRIERPLLDIRLYVNRVFAGAAFVNFGLGAALFGAMILVPLYYQEVRGESVINTGLLTGPQGIGALIAMPLASRLTQRFSGGRVALGGILLLCVSTIPFTFIGADTSIVAISLVLVVRGLSHRDVLHARDERRLLGDAPRAGLRRHPADHRAAADRWRDRHRGARRRVAARGCRRALPGGARERVRHRLLVGARDRRAVADSLRGAVAGREATAGKARS